MFNVALNENYGLLNGTINNKVLDYTYGTNQNVTWLKDSITNYELEMIYGSNKIESLNYGGTPTQFDYEYDLNGNVLKDHKAQYNYDSKNNLEFSKTKIKVNGSETTVLTKYYYNGLNQRIAKEIQGGQIKYFVYNENDQVIGEYDNNGNVINEYVYFGLRPVAVRTGVNINIVHTDYLGSPRIITSGTNGGSTVWEWKNDNPYGNNKATGSIEFNLRFAGQYYDSELHYNINRTYDPEVGRYMQSDPIGLAGGSNTYNYVNRNPLSNVDPLGLYTRIIVAEGDKNHIGHVAIDINGTTYGLMPGVKANANNVALFVPGYIDVKSFESFKEHYFEPKEYVSTIHAYDINLNKEEEDSLLKDIQKDLNTQLVSGSKFNIFYQGTAYTENNCASWATTKINKYTKIGVNIFPWTVRNNLSWEPRSIVSKYQKYERE